MNREQRIVVVGFGNMGQALVRGWLDRGVNPRSIHVVDLNPAALGLAEQLGIARSTTAADALRMESPDVVLLAVKPIQLGEALRECVPAARRALFLSIAAGKRIDSIAASLGAGAAIVRAMPNTPAAIGRGMTVLTASPAVSDAQRVLAAELMSAVGVVEWLEDEQLMDAVTAVSGSGPAYVFLLIECLARAGVAAGLDSALAKKLATVTVAGAGAYAEASNDSAAELRRRVTSPGGTTEAALAVLNADDAMTHLFEAAVLAAAARGRELAKD